MDFELEYSYLFSILMWGLTELYDEWYNKQFEDDSETI